MLIVLNHGQLMSATIPYDIPTPALVIDEVAVKRNIARLADYGRKHLIGIRPHTKTHKSIRMAKAQLDAGAVGLTVAKVGEAEVMAVTGGDLLLAYPALDPFRTGRIAELAKAHSVRVSLDSTLAADNIASAADKIGVTVGMLADIDVGMHRTGVQTIEQSLALAQHISRLKGARLDGIMFYVGHIWGPPADMVTKLGEVNRFIQSAIDLWKKHGLEARIVTGGSTPTAFESHHVPAQTEIRPGTYIYYDRNCLAGNWCTLDDCAARIIATVMSDAVPDKVIVDAGNKTLTMDPLATDAKTGGHGLVVEYPLAKLTRLSEEHGEMDLSAYTRRPKLGDRVQIVPNHVCPCVNLHNSAWLRREDGKLEKLPIDARGLLS